VPVSMFDSNRRSRFLLWMFHRGARFNAGAFVIIVASDIYPRVTAIDILAIIALVTVIALWLITQYHGLILCPFCAAATPLNGPGKAQGRAKTLRYAHWMTGGQYMIIYIAVGTMALVLFFVFIMTLGAGRADLAVDWWLVESSIEMYVLSVHGSLQPWCPQCHWDDGGDHEPSPAISREKG
jgi:hypothetical protein